MCFNTFLAAWHSFTGTERCGLKNSRMIPSPASTEHCTGESLNLLGHIVWHIIWLQTADCKENCYSVPASIISFSMIFSDPDEFDRIYEPLDVTSKKIHVVDSGLTYNLPYPLILRPQRGVNLIISFDFSARPSDSSPPFKVRLFWESQMAKNYLCQQGIINTVFSHLEMSQELLLAEKWARMNKLPFPKIDPKVFDREGLKECYVFKPKKGERNCPTVIHFVLVNINFRQFKAPGKWGKASLFIQYSTV